MITTDSAALAARTTRLVLAGSHIVPLGKQHLHEECVVWGMALHVLEVQEVLSALSHFSQVGQ